ncbi:hypothetical protein AgCh_034318 [Apium graveolens]
MSSPAMEAALAGEGEAGTVEGNWGQGRLSAVTGKRNPAITDRNHAVWGGSRLTGIKRRRRILGFLAGVLPDPFGLGTTRLQPGFDPVLARQSKLGSEGSVNSSNKQRLSSASCRRSNHVVTSNITAEAVKDGLKSFSEGGISPRFLIVDDGWQQIGTDNKGNDCVLQEGMPFASRLTRIKENVKFQNKEKTDNQTPGLQILVNDAKKRHNVKYV